MDSRESRPGDDDQGSDGPTWSTTPTDALIRLICDDERHLEIGRSVPEGAGHITVRAGEWGYCTASREEEPHTWTEVSARPLSAIRHADPLGEGRSA
jgi:hypothetical protein